MLSQRNRGESRTQSRVYFGYSIPSFWHGILVAENVRYVRKWQSSKAKPSMTDWPSYKRARDLAGAVFPISEAMILQLARQHGVGRKAGRCIVFSIDDVQRLYEVLPCPSKLSAGQNLHIESSAVHSAESDLTKAQALTTRRPRKKSARSERPKSSPNQSTDVVLQQRSHRLP